MIKFRQTLQHNCMTIAERTVGQGTDPTNFVRTFDNHLHDVELDEMPFMVVNVRTAENAEKGEIGTAYDLYQWTVHFYYLHIAEDYNEGEAARDEIMGKLEKALEEDRFLDHCEHTDEDGHREYVFDSSISAGLFDSSGQEEYYSFISELYLNVYTAKS